MNNMETFQQIPPNEIQFLKKKYKDGYMLILK